jgi:cbb3-type cytochrome oxidase maturation protein
VSSWVLWLELVVAIIVSVILLSLFIKAVKQGQFDDGKRMMNGLLNDSTQDLQDAVKKDEKIKAMREKKANKKTNHHL